MDLIDTNINSQNEQIERASQAAHEWSTSSAEVRAQLLRALADGLDSQREQLVALAHQETHLGAPRLNGELDRTCFQLRALAQHVAEGAVFASEQDDAVPLPPPQGRPRMLRVRVPVGPVAMFAASNFPFAFSVLGGDTASALAAGCPVVVRAHPAHPRLSRAVFQIAQAVLQQQMLPPGLIALVEGESIEIGAELVKHPAIKAVAFTGSTRGGLALEAIASHRQPPIPFFGELGSINPVVVVPGALEGRVEDLAGQIAGSVVLGMGQFCTRPGVLAMVNDEETRDFIAALAKSLSNVQLHPMLTPGIAQSFVSTTQALASLPGIRVVCASDTAAPAPFLAVLNAATFLGQPQFREEIFGPALIVVMCESQEELPAVMKAVAGSLAVTIWGADTDTPFTRRLVSDATQAAGRVLFEGVPTGVAVTRAQQHGGPWPSSTQPASTSVGLHACDRFLRPVVYQSAPQWVTSRNGRPL